MKSIYIIYILIISNFFIYITSFKTDCPVYKCSMNGMKDDKCFSRGDEYIDGKMQTTIYLSQCTNGRKCSKVSWDPSIGVCTTNIRKAFGGEKCQSNADCYSQDCDSHNVCQDKKIDEKCSDDKQCCKECVCIFDPLIGQTPNDKTCRPLVKLGEKCILDESDPMGLHSDCPIFSVCSNFDSKPDAKNGIYVEQNSLPIGENATNFQACIGNNIILLQDGYYVCANISSRSDICHVSRDQSTECVNEIIVLNGQEIDPLERMIQSQGICRCDVDGQKHCQTYGGTMFDHYINLIRKKIEKGNIIPKNFHVSAFRETLNDYEIAEAYFNYKYDGTKADYCTKKYFIDNSLLAFEYEIRIDINIFLLFLLFILL